MKRLLCLFLCAAIVMALVPALSLGESLQPCHRAEVTCLDTDYPNGSVMRVYHVKTALPEVDKKINSIADKFASKYGINLPEAKNKTSLSSRLDVEIRYSRTGLTYMSFMVQARETYHRSLTRQPFTTRTFDMTTGQRIYLTDLFSDDSGAWDILQQEISRQVTACFGEKNQPDGAELARAMEDVRNADFTLHGMSLTLHYPADRFYPGHHTIINVTVMYPELYDHMTDRGYEETNNLAYYKTCALTFDDGPSGENTPKVLKALMESGSVGTFFVIGNRIDEFQYLVQRENDEGHAIGTHNWHHGDVRKSSDAALQMMPEKCDKALIAAIGIPSRYDRVPSGLYPRMIKARAGWPLIQWSLDTYDWRGRSTNVVLSTVKKQIEDGDIILCHDIKENTPESAREICSYLAEEGYIMLTIDELFAKDQVELMPNKVYYRCQDGDTSEKR